MTNFHNPSASLFTRNWQQYREEVAEGNTRAVWQRRGDVLAAVWRGLMCSVLHPVAYELLDSHNWKWELRRRLWLKPGGYILTRAEKPRHFWRWTTRQRAYWNKKLKWVKSQSLDDEISLAGAEYSEAIAPHQLTLTVALVALSGGIIRPRFIKRKEAREGVNRMRELRLYHPWPWPKSVGRRLQNARTLGLVQTVGDWEKVR